MTLRPLLLFVSPRFLFPASEGGKIRTASILRKMKGGAFELVLASPSPLDVRPFAADLEGVCDNFLSWQEATPSRLRRLWAIVGRLPVSVAADRSAAGRACIVRALAQKPEVVVVDFPHADVLMPNQITADTHTPACVIFTHNVEAEIFERHAQIARGIRRIVWRDQSRKMQIFERAVLRRYDAVIAVSARDAEMLHRRYCLKGVQHIDTGVDLNLFQFTAPSAAPGFGPEGGTIVFIGAMDWPANVDGMTFLMNEVWPRVARVRPEARAAIVGRNPPSALVARAHQLGLQWMFTGFVDDVRPYIADAHVFVIPLRVGSGTRMKAFEAMAMGRPLVSTRIGVEGLDIVPGQHYVAADTAEEFAAAIVRLLDDPGLSDALASAARARLEDRHSWSHVARQFEKICMSALQKHCAG